jgi:hypothetical protein
MAKKSTKPTVTTQPPLPSEAAPLPQDALGSPNIDKAVDAAFDEAGKIQAKRDALARLLAGVEKQKAKLREAEADYQSALNAVDELQADLIAKYPAAARVFGAAITSKRVKGRKAAKVGGAKKGGNTLNLEQANQVLAAMPGEFELGAYGKKTRELFPEFISAGAMKLLKEKVRKLGGKGKGIRYRKV